MKPLHDVPEAGITRFAIYHPHYKDKLVGNPTRKFVSAANRLYFLCGWSNLPAAVFFAHDSGTCAAELDIVTKKGEPPRTSLRRSQLPSLPSLPLLDSTFSKMRLAMFKYLAIFKCAPVSEWQSENLLEVSSDPSLAAQIAAQIAAQTVKSLPDDNALSNKRLQWQITNKSRGLCYVKLDQDTLLLSQIGCIICLANAIIKANIIHWCKQVTCGILAAKLYAMAHGFGIEKRHWGRYQIVRTKSYQHLHYGIGETGKA